MWGVGNGNYIHFFRPLGGCQSIDCLTLPHQSAIMSFTKCSLPRGSSHSGGCSRNDPFRVQSAASYELAQRSGSRPVSEREFPRNERFCLLPPITLQSSPAKATVINDGRSIAYLVDLLIARSGVSQKEVARRLGVAPQSLNQYRMKRRARPSAQWLARLAEVCGARLVVELGSRAHS